MVYKKLTEIFYEKAFEQQRARGAKVQRIVWGSTGTKNPKYSDVLYVEEIIGPDTINTAPIATLNAFLDHGKPRLSLMEEVAIAEKELTSLKKFNIDLNAVTDQLQKDGVQAFIQSFDQLIESLRGRCSVN